MKKNCYKVSTLLSKITNIFSFILILNNAQALITLHKPSNAVESSILSKISSIFS